jgi:hypothetical protein
MALKLESLPLAGTQRAQVRAEKSCFEGCLREQHLCEAISGLMAQKPGFYRRGRRGRGENQQSWDMHPGEYPEPQRKSKPSEKVGLRAVALVKD